MLSQFLVGTTALHGGNSIHVVDYDSNANELKKTQVYAHEDQVLSLSPCPFAKDRLITCSKAKGEAAEATLWKMDGLDDEPSGEDPTPSPLNSLAVLPTQASPPSRVVWRPDGSASDTVLASAHDKSVLIWDLAGDAFSRKDRIDADGGVRAVQWDPHHDHLLSFSSGATIQTWDTRSNATSFIIEDAHAGSVLDFDYNPNKPYTVVTGGEDGLLRFWDLRQSARPLLSLVAHSHWLWCVRYNRFHDQLVLSSSSDSTLALWRVSSISSAPIVELDEQDFMNESAAGNDVADSRVKSYEEHEDSVYSVAWGAGSDSWVFASVSYDGRVVVNQVPSSEKYKILL